MSRDLFKTSPHPKGPTEKQQLESEITDLQAHRDIERIPVSDIIKGKLACLLSIYSNLKEKRACTRNDCFYKFTG